MSIWFRNSGYPNFNKDFPHREKPIPAYVLALASKGRGVRTHYDAFGIAIRQNNYIMYEGQ